MLHDYLTNNTFTLDTYKGAPGNFRPRNNQLRQAVLLHTHNAVIARTRSRASCTRPIIWTPSAATSRNWPATSIRFEGRLACGRLFSLACDPAG